MLNSFPRYLSPLQKSEQIMWMQRDVCLEGAKHRKVFLCHVAVCLALQPEAIELKEHVCMFTIKCSVLKRIAP